MSLVVSGGHTILLLLQTLTSWKKLGETRDDAAGEAFDKVARLLGLVYPGGPEVEKLAKKGDASAINFPRPMIHQKNYDFSFSGLKTAVLYYLKMSESSPLRKVSREANLSDVAASFQKAVVDVLVAKTVRAAEAFGARSIMLCGGVAANKFLRKELQKASRKIGNKFVVPDFEFNTDNAAMIAVAAYVNFLKKKKLKLAAQPNLNL